MDHRAGAVTGGYSSPNSAAEKITDHITFWHGVTVKPAPNGVSTTFSAASFVPRPALRRLPALKGAAPS